MKICLNRIALGALAAFVFLGGCTHWRTGLYGDYGRDEAFLNVVKKGDPSRLRVAVGFYDAINYDRANRRPDERFTVEISDAEKRLVSERLAGLLSGKAFVNGDKKPASGVIPVFKGCPVNTLETDKTGMDWEEYKKALLDKAWGDPRDPDEDFYDLLVLFKLKKFETSSEGTNSNYVWAILANFYAFFGWWIPAEVFSAHVEMEMNVYAVHSGETVAEFNLDSGKLQREFDAFDRGWKPLTDIFTLSIVRPSPGEDDWRRIRNKLGDEAMRKIHLDMLGYFKGEFSDFMETPEAAKKISKKMALVIGVDKQVSAGIHSRKACGNDAAQVAKFLDEKCGFKDPILLTGDDAGRENIKRILQGLPERLNPQDTFVLYFSGYGSRIGSTKDPKPVLVVSDTLSNKEAFAQTAVGFDELVKWLDPIVSKCYGASAVFDCSFGGEGERTYAQPDQKGGKSRFGRYFIDVRNSTGLNLVFASSPGYSEPAIEPEASHEIKIMETGKEMGVFTYYLLNGMGYLSSSKEDLPADNNPSDERVSLGEAFDYARTRVYERQELLGRPQKPCIFQSEKKGRIFLIGKNDFKRKAVFGTDENGKTDETTE